MRLQLRVVRMITPYTPVPPRFPDQDCCPVCGGVKHCLKGKAEGEALRRRVDCPEGRPRFW